MKKIHIQKLRKEAGMTQADLAQRLGISLPTLIAVEKGRRSLTLVEREKVNEIFRSVHEVVAKYASDMRISIPEQKVEKFREVLLYILEKVGSKPNVGMTVLYKLLYFMDFDYYEKYEEQFMGLTYIKNRHGPSPKEFAKVLEQMKRDEHIEQVHSKYFTYEQKKFLPLVRADLSKLTGRELEMIDNVLARLSDKSAKELSDYSHQDVPWISHKEGEEMDYESVFYRNDPYSVRQDDDI